MNVTASSSTITATATGTAVEAGVSSSTVSASSSGGIGPQGPQGPPGTADLPEGTEGQVLTYVGGQWTAAAPANPFDQSLNIGENVEFGSVLLPNGTQITEGSFDNGTGGQNGISIHCYVGYELNWQGGRLRSTSDGGTTTAQIWFDSPIEFQGEGGSVYIDATGITFPDETSQTTAWTGSVSAGDVSGLAAVATSGDYADLSNAPGQYTLPAANATTLGGIIVGTGLSFFANGSVSVSYGTGPTNACRGDDSRLSNARTPTSHVHGNLTNAGAIGSTSGQIVVTTTAGVLTTAASISLSQISQSSATTGQVVAWNGTAWAPAAASGYTLPNATTSTLGGVIVGTGLGVTSGTVSVSYGTSSSTACVGNDARLSDSRTPLAHTHAIADVTSLQTTLDGKAASSHGHAIADVTGLQTALDGKQASGSYAAASHSHAVGDLTQSGATTNQVIQWNGSAWAPATVSGGSSAWSSITGTPTTLAGYGITDAASSSHTHAASDITSGTIATARLASGTASATTYLRGDQTWATVSSGSATTNAADLTSGTLNDARLSFVPLHPFLLMGG